METRPININITSATIFKIIGAFVVLYFLYLINDVLIILFVSLIFASAFDPWVDWLENKKIPRAFSILLIYLILLAILGLLVYLIIPPILEQSKQMIDHIFNTNLAVLNKSSYEYAKLNKFFEDAKINLSDYSPDLRETTKNLFGKLISIFGSIFSFILILVMTFYMVVEENAIKKLVWSITPAKHQPYVMHLINRMQKKIGLWLRGQLILNFIIFLMIYIGLTILGVKYALVLALIAGIAESIPYFGPILGAVPAVLLAYNQSPMLSLFVAGFYYIVQLTENNILVPKIMQKAVGINPILSIAVLWIGFKLAGVLGAILSIPVTTAVSVFINDIIRNKERADSESD